MKKKRIAIVVETFPTISETFIVNQINSLIDLGYCVSVFAYKKGDSLNVHNSLKTHNLTDKVAYFKPLHKNKFYRLLGLCEYIFRNFYRINWKKLIRVLNIIEFGKLAYSLKLFNESLWFLSSPSFDIIQTHFGPISNRIANLKEVGVIDANTKFVATFHGYDLIPNNAKNYNREYKVLLKNADLFSVNSLYLKKILIELMISDSKIRILPVGLDTNVFRRKQKKDENFFFDIIFCGRLIKLKGPDRAIKILIKLHELGYVDCRLHIVGDGIMRNELKDLIVNNKLEEHVFLYGALTQEQLILKLEAADVLLMPGVFDPITYRAETQGLVIQEAQSMQLPVIVSDVGGMKFGLIPNETGYVIKHDDLDLFVKSIVKLILNPNLRMRMGEKGRHFVKENFDNKRIVKKLLELYF